MLYTKLWTHNAVAAFVDAEAAVALGADFPRPLQWRFLHPSRRALFLDMILWEHVLSTPSSQILPPLFFHRGWWEEHLFPHFPLTSAAATVSGLGSSLTCARRPDLFYRDLLSSIFSFFDSPLPRTMFANFPYSSSSSSSSSSLKAALIFLASSSFLIFSLVLSL